MLYVPRYVAAVVGGLRHLGVLSEMPTACLETVRFPCLAVMNQPDIDMGPRRGIRVPWLSRLWRPSLAPRLSFHSSRPYYSCIDDEHCKDLICANHMSGRASLNTT